MLPAKRRLTMVWDTLPRFSFAFLLKKTGNKRAAGVGSLLLGEDQEEKRETQPSRFLFFFLRCLG